MVIRELSNKPEIEFKFQFVPDEHGALLRQCADSLAPDYALDIWQTRITFDIYFDTPDLCLCRHGGSLRLRKSSTVFGGKRRWTMNFKPGSRAETVSYLDRQETRTQLSEIDDETLIDGPPDGSTVHAAREYLIGLGCARDVSLEPAAHLASHRPWYGVRSPQFTDCHLGTILFDSVLAWDIRGRPIGAFTSKNALTPVDAFHPPISLHVGEFELIDKVESARTTAALELFHRVLAWFRAQDRLLPAKPKYQVVMDQFDAQL